MRIDANNQTNGVNGRNTSGRASGGAAFEPVGVPQQSRAQSAAPVAAAADISALLALQAVEDPLSGRKKKALKRGKSLLDKLEEIKADLLVGQVSESRLDSLMLLIGEARERSVPELDDLLDGIELRVRVELAKFGRFPGE
ncbi:flagellar assembly protein FliX [Devosia rhodophyticola]|uniref:Flagellar assembly protein FliX n=1 Tax=Devosia rhodophyticola TaxID=3026423 RepID=A0ABY7YW50_9HYPH|nr:flagellar assembly protein FliX [Devosia rhodophyticola]WDR05417.1 flagellar assembly protein FliX [Devosia rhodophyticola]